MKKLIVRMVVDKGMPEEYIERHVKQELAESLLEKCAEVFKEKLEDIPFNHLRHIEGQCIVMTNDQYKALVQVAIDAEYILRQGKHHKTADTLIKAVGYK